MTYKTKATLTIEATEITLCSCCYKILRLYMSWLWEKANYLTQNLHIMTYTI